MGYSVNKATVLGNVGKDPEYKVISTGSALCKFSVATTEKYKNREDEMVEQTEWHNIEIWGKLADIANQYLRKGNKVYIEGRIKTDTYEKDGITRYSTKIVATDMVLLSGKDSSDSGSYAPRPAQQNNFKAEDVKLSSDDLDDVPF
jgi:single-strand DNA-binding protein